MDCSKFEEIVFLYSDNQLERELVVLYRRHIELCPQCARKAVYTERLLTILRRRCNRAAAPAELRERILAGLRGTDDYQDV
jgi:mycothiol system anti-sigma-R factor